MNRYDTISKGTCPECHTKMHRAGNMGLGDVCRECGIFFYFSDDVGGSYTQRTIKGGKAWQQEKIEEAEKLQKQHMDILKEIMNTSPPTYKD